MTAIDPCSRPVLAASTPNAPNPPAGPPDAGCELPGRASPNSVSLGSGLPRASIPGLRLTERDCQIVELVFRTRALTGAQIQTALFSAGAASRCQLRLTKLVRNHYLDCLPRKAVNEPAIYVLSRKSVEGNRLLRERLGEEEYRKGQTRLGALGHLLAANEVMVRTTRACADLGYLLKFWQRSEELVPLVASSGLVPDAYFQVQRQVAGQSKTAGFFLELEKAGKSSQVLRSKLKRYGELYYGGAYQRLFRTRALRLLVVFAADDDRAAARRVEAGVEEASRLGVTIAHFASLAELKALPPVACLAEAVWAAPEAAGKVALLPPAVGSREVPEPER